MFYVKKTIMPFLYTCLIQYHLAVSSAIINLLIRVDEFKMGPTAISLEACPHRTQKIQYGGLHCTGVE
jgi:hypothetical protein